MEDPFCGFYRSHEKRSACFYGGFFLRFSDFFFDEQDIFSGFGLWNTDTVTARKNGSADIFFPEGRIDAVDTDDLLRSAEVPLF